MKLPLEYRWIKAHNFDGLTPWYFIDPMNSDGIKKEFKLETGKEIVPFARRQDNDDIAGFEVSNGIVSSKVLTVHLTWSGKNERNEYPITESSKDIFDWISNMVIPETKEWICEEELEDILKEKLNDN